MILRNVKPSAFKGGLILVFGFGIQLVEATTLAYFFATKSILKYQFLIGTIFFATGAFILARSTVLNTFTSVGQLGAKHSLLIYIFHPYFIFIFIFIFIFNFLPLSPLLSDILIVPIVFLSSLKFSVILEKNFTTLYHIANGDLKFLTKREY